MVRAHLHARAVAFAAVAIDHRHDAAGASAASDIHLVFRCAHLWRPDSSALHPGYSGLPRHSTSSPVPLRCTRAPLASLTYAYSGCREVAWMEHSAIQERVVGWVPGSAAAPGLLAAPKRDSLDIPVGYAHLSLCAPPARFPFPMRVSAACACVARCGGRGGLPSQSASSSTRSRKSAPTCRS